MTDQVLEPVHWHADVTQIAPRRWHIRVGDGSIEVPENGYIVRGDRQRAVRKAVKYLNREMGRDSSGETFTIEGQR